MALRSCFRTVPQNLAARFASTATRQSLPSLRALRSPTVATAISRNYCQEARDGRSIAQKANRGFWIFMGFTGATAGGVLAGIAGNVIPTPGASEEEAETMTFSEKMDRVKTYVNNFFFEPMRDKLLPDFEDFVFGGQPAPPDFVAPPTLVLDLDETLVHTEWTRARGHRTMKRPGLDAFLQHISQLYEVVIYCSAINSYGETVVNTLEGIHFPSNPFEVPTEMPQGKNYITHRLYRECTKYEDGVFKKDVTKLNRDLKKVVVIDDSPDESSLAVDNRILVKPFTGGRDTTLMDLVPLLEHLHQVAMSGGDVREVLKHFEGKEDLVLAFREYMREQRKQKKQSHLFAK